VFIRVLTENREFIIEEQRASYTSSGFIYFGSAHFNVFSGFVFGGFLSTEGAEFSDSLCVDFFCLRQFRFSCM
jgi:hypothetical protein